MIIRTVASTNGATKMAPQEDLGSVRWAKQSNTSAGSTSRRAHPVCSE